MSEIKKALEEKYPVPEKLLPENIGKLIDEKKALKKRKKIRIFTAVTSVAACCAIAVGVGVSSLGSKGPEADDSSSDTITTTFKASLNDTIVEESFSGSFSSYDDIFSKLSALYEENQYNDIGIDMEIAVDENAVEDSFTEMVPEVGINSSLKGEVPDSDASNSVDYYETYEQVEGVSEADVIKTDGKFIYYLSNRMIYVINTEGDILSKTEIASYYYDSEMYLKNNKVIITYENSNETFAKIYSVSDMGELNEEAIYSQSGTLCTSRLIDDKLYLISYYYMNSIEGADIKTPESFVPVYDINGKDFIVDADCIYINDTQSFNGYTVISGIDIDSAEEAISVKSVFGSYPQIYCSQENIYLMSNFTKYEKVDGGFNFNELFYSDYEFCKCCYITKLSINDGEIGEVSRVIVDGNTLNQFSGDEYEGYFRVAVNRGSDNALYVYDENLKQVGFVGGMGINEQIKSVNFDGNTGYIVTFRQTDPLYTIDLSDPENPVITDELKISGFSTHLRQFRDGLMIGFGYEADVDSGITSGLKLSMFEADENGKQQEIAKVVISQSDNYYYVGSPATSNHKYLLINSEKNIIGFPYTAYGEYIVDGDFSDYYDTTLYSYMYAIYSYTENGFELLNKIQVTSEEVRAIYIENTIYIFSENNVYLADISTGEIIKEITLS